MKNARRIIDTLGPSSSLSTHLESYQATPSIRELSVPPPHPITSSLVAQGLKLPAAEKLSNAYLHSARSLKAEYDRELQQSIAACIASGSDPDLNTQSTISAIKSTYVSRYSEIVNDWRNRVTVVAAQRVSALRRNSSLADIESSKAVERRSTFKHVSLLTSS